MKLLKGYTLLSSKNYDELEGEALARGEAYAAKHVKNLRKENAKLEDRIEDLVSDHKRETKSYERQVERLQIEVDALEEARDDAEKVIKLQVQLEDDVRIQKAKKDSLTRLEDSLMERETKVTDSEEGRYKVGYADGVADGLRKVNEITAKDRENAMKIAMVSAASHTPVGTMKEINSELRIAQGSEDTEGK